MIRIFELEEKKATDNLINKLFLVTKKQSLVAKKLVKPKIGIVHFFISSFVEVKFNNKYLSF